MRRRCPGCVFTTRPRTEEFSCDAGGRVESQDEDDAPAVRVCPRPRRPLSGAHRSRCPRFPARRGRRGRRPRERRACCLLRAWCPIRPRGLAQDASELRPALAPVPPRARSTAVRPPVGGARARPDHPAGAGACRSVLPLTAVASALAPLLRSVAALAFAAATAEAFAPSPLAAARPAKVYWRVRACALLDGVSGDARSSRGHVRRCCRACAPSTRERHLTCGAGPFRRMCAQVPPPSLASR